jgi:hypothetical protein
LWWNADGWNLKLAELSFNLHSILFMSMAVKFHFYIVCQTASDSIHCSIIDAISEQPLSIPHKTPSRIFKNSILF